MSYYECHITLRPLHLKGPPPNVQAAVEALKWRYSAIDGDPALGKGVLHYATKHFKAETPLEEVIYDMNNVAFHLRYSHGLDVIRQKVELVVYDTKQAAHGPA